ncbi:prephenate dehydrogenase [Chloroflexota bacterium]
MGEQVKIAVIGGYGKMGQWFADFLIKDGKEVVISGRDEKKLLEAKQQLGEVEIAGTVEAVKGADVILISVPIDAFERVIEEICPYIRPEQIIIDITSIKVLPVETMHKHIKTGLILGTHPMFGPGARSMKNQNIVLTPTNEDETALAQKVKGYLETKGACVNLMTPREHDEMVAIILGLAHFIAIVSADTLLSFENLKQMRKIAGTTYKVLLTLIGGVVSRDPEFYATLQMSLPNMTEIETLFQRNSKTWADLVKTRDKQEFIRRMNILRDRLEKEEPDFGEAYENIYKLAEGL